MSITKSTDRSARRRLLTALAAGGGAVLARNGLPEQWRKPAIGSVLAPAHALTTGGLPFSSSTVQLGGTGRQGDGVESLAGVGGQQQPLTLTRIAQSIVTAAHAKVELSLPLDLSLQLFASVSGTVVDRVQCLLHVGLGGNCGASLLFEGFNVSEGSLVILNSVNCGEEALNSFLDRIGIGLEFFLSIQVRVGAISSTGVEIKGDPRDLKEYILVEAMIPETTLLTPGGAPFPPPIDCVSQFEDNCTREEGE